jgi:uncharacterized protein (TIGR03437 family)
MLLQLAVVLFGAQANTDSSATHEGPYYTEASIVNAADNQPGRLAPNTIATMYGSGLAYTTKAITKSDIRGGTLPTVLPGTGVRVLIGGLPAIIYYVSPGQINFLVPSYLLPASFNVQVILDGLAGPPVSISLLPAAPALFETGQQNAVATRPDGKLISPKSPAKPGDWVILYATGLGQTAPPVIYGEVPTTAAEIEQLSTFKLTLDGVAVERSRIYYVGLAPYFAGLYQINLKLPHSVGANPEIRISIGKQISAEGVCLPVQP